MIGTILMRIIIWNYYVVFNGNAWTMCKSVELGFLVVTMIMLLVRTIIYETFFS